jgi:hypothetical protein
MGRATWLRIPATCASVHSLVHGGRGEGGADKGGPRYRERENRRAGQWLGVWQSGPMRQRGTRGARVKKPALTTRPHLAASKREGRERGTVCR